MLKKIIITSLIALFAMILFLFIHIRPILRPLPEPNGAYAVGRRTYHLIDSAAKEPRQPSGHAAFMAQIYYPSSSKKGDQRYPYDQGKLEAYKKLQSRTSWLPTSFWNGLFDGITSFAQPDAPIAQQGAPFPVLLFLPGIGTLPLYGSLLEQLASHGYIVVEIEPPFDVELVLFPEGRIVELDPVLKKAMAATDRTTIYAYRAAAHARWLRYLAVAIEKLRLLNDDPQSPFYRAIDLKHLGVIGHSHGGGVATDFCAHNAICKAGINMDGWTKSAQKIEPFSKPFLFLMSEKGIEEVTQLAALMPEYATKVDLKGMEHAGFSDLAFLKQPIAWLFGMTPATDAQVRDFQKRILPFCEEHIKRAV